MKLNFILLLKKITALSIIVLLICHSQIFSQEKEEEKKDTTVYKYELPDEVMVTGTRTEEKMMDIPYSVFKMTDKKELKFGEKISAKDILMDVPGIFIQNRYGNKDIRISLRGFGTRSNTGIRGIKILQDGIPVSEPDGETVVDDIDFTSLGGVEVVKGNLSSLYANAPGGIINFVTDIYFKDNFISTGNQFGSYGYNQNGIKLGLKNSNNRLFVSYQYRDLKGYRPHSSEYQHLLNTVYEGYLGTDSYITILGSYVDGLNKIPGSLTPEEYAQDPFQASPLAITETQDFRRITRKGRLGIRFRSFFGENKNNELEITGYGGLKEQEKSQLNSYPISTRYSLGSFIRFVNSSNILNRINKITLGMDYAYQTGPITEFENIQGNRGFSVLNEFDESLSNIGFYFLDHFNLVKDKLDIFAAGRYDRYAYSRNIYQPFGFTDTSRVFQNFTPKVGLNYKIIPSIAVFANYGYGFDYPVLMEMDNSPLTSEPKYSINPDLNPQKSQNFEIGIKGKIDNKKSVFMKEVKFEVTLFNYIVEDEIVPYTINQKTYFRNAAKTNRLGIETGFKSEPFEHVEWAVNYTYTHFKYDNYIATIYNPSGTTTEDYEGNFVPSYPNHIVNFILAYELELSDDIEGLILWDCDYVSDMYADDANTVKVPGYFYGNILTGIEFEFEKYSLSFYGAVNNIFDKRYIGFININDFNKRYFETGEPRTFQGGFTVKYKL